MVEREYLTQVRACGAHEAEPVRLGSIVRPLVRRDRIGAKLLKLQRGDETVPYPLLSHRCGEALFDHVYGGIGIPCGDSVGAPRPPRIAGSVVTRLAGLRRMDLRRQIGVDDVPRAAFSELASLIGGDDIVRRCDDVVDAACAISNEPYAAEGVDTCQGALCRCYS